MLPPNTNAWEPVELRKLKSKLATLSCTCSSCDKSKTLIPCVEHSDQQVQVDEPKRNSFNRCTQVNSEKITKDNNVFLNTIAKEILCPSCFVTMNLLRGGALRILKDQDSETNSEMFTCNKSVENYVKAVEKSTSIISKPNPKYSNLTFCDFLSECSSDMSVVQHESKVHQVKFLDDQDEEDEPVRRNVDEGRHCMCLENFIDSIRPPLEEQVFRTS